MFDVTKTEELDTILGLPKSEAAHIDDAASAVHMMNANTFTGAAYHLTDDADMESFVSAVKENILAKQWICRMPDTLIILGVGDEYVITAYGAEEIIEVFKTQALSSLDGATVLIETPAVE